MTDLNDQEYAEVLRLELDRAGLRTTGHAVTDYLRMRISELDPPDPYAGLNRVRWVEIEDGYGTRRVTHVRGARESHPDWSLVRVVPDGDARDVLVIPVKQVRGKVRYAHTSDQAAAHQLLSDALAEHNERWSS